MKVPNALTFTSLARTFLALIGVCVGAGINRATAAPNPAAPEKAELYSLRSQGRISKFYVATNILYKKLNSWNAEGIPFEPNIRMLETKARAHVQRTKATRFPIKLTSIEFKLYTVSKMSEFSPDGLVRTRKEDFWIIIVRFDEEDESGGLTMRSDLVAVMLFDGTVAEELVLNP